MRILRNSLLGGIVVVILLAGLIGKGSVVFAHDHSEMDMSVETAQGQSTSKKVINITSIILVSLATLFFVVRVGGNGAYLSKMTGMMGAMTSAMMSSVVLGTIVGLMFQKLFLSTVIAVLVGMIVGFITGRTLSLMASLDGMMSGVMGGMMGPMLGVMVINDHPILTVLFMDIVFAVMMSVLYQLLKNEVQSEITARASRTTTI
jgi:hypothetical protein